MSACYIATSYLIDVFDSVCLGVTAFKVTSNNQDVRVKENEGEFGNNMIQSYLKNMGHCGKRD